MTLFISFYVTLKQYYHLPFFYFKTSKHDYLISFNSFLLNTFDFIPFFYDFSFYYIPLWTLKWSVIAKSVLALTHNRFGALPQIFEREQNKKKTFSTLILNFGFKFNQSLNTEARYKGGGQNLVQHFRCRYLGFFFYKFNHVVFFSWNEIYF